MGDFLSEQWGSWLVVSVLATVALWGVQWLNKHVPIVRLVQSLVTGTSTIMAVILVVEWVTIADQIESAMHQIYHVGILIAAILCVGLSMACWRWFATSAEPKPSATPPMRQEPSPPNPDEQQQHEREMDAQRQRVREMVDQEKAERQEDA